ncbi:MAG: hypothetical protein E5Y58_07455 [Mesorhizobium sp.]|nr:MAG: hypothetical protein E5Y58_07455 [Mesorhizobium sp.]
MRLPGCDTRRSVRPDEHIDQIMRLDQRGDSAHSTAMTAEDHDFSHLDRFGRAAASASGNPRLAVNIVLGAAVVLAWLLLGAMAIRGAESRVPGIDAPGDTMLRYLPGLPLPDILERFFSLCLAPAPLDGGVGAQAGALIVMWFLMAVATMLPSAAPMIRTYCEIADTARIKGEAVVHPLILVAGYLSVWLAASAVFAALTLIVHAFASSVQMLDPVVGATGAAALLVAGLYQFSGLKCHERVVAGVDRPVHLDRKTDGGQAANPGRRCDTACLGNRPASSLGIGREFYGGSRLGNERRVGALLQLHGFLSLRAVSRQSSADRGLLSDLGGVPHRCRPFRRGRAVRSQSWAGHGNPRLYEPRQLDRRTVHRQARLSLRGKGADQDFHRQGRRDHLAALHPGRKVPRRRAGADHL